MAIKQLDLGSKKSGFTLSFSPDSKRRGGASLGATLTTFDKLDLPDEALQSVQNAVRRWVRDRLQPRIPKVVRRVLYERSGKLATEPQVSVGSYESAESRGKHNVYEFKIAMNLGKAMKYGGVQEYGRAAKGKRKSKYYMVPLAKSFPQTKEWTRSAIEAALSEPGVFWAPRGDNNFGEDKSGRPVKYVFQLKKGLRPRYKKAMAKGLDKARAGMINRAANKKGTALSAKEELKSWAKLLFLAYPRPYVTGIPGSGHFQSKKIRETFNTAALSKFNIGAGKLKGRGAGEASRWYSRSLAAEAGSLDQYMHDPELRKAIRGAVKSALEAQSGINFGGRTASKGGAE